MSQEEEIVDSIKTTVASLKYKLERQDAIDKLGEVDMTLSRLQATRAGTKICEVFRSSRFGQASRDLHGKWIATAERELKERWDELIIRYENYVIGQEIIKHQFLSKDQIVQLDRAQARYNKKHGLVKVSAISKKAHPKKAENPYQKVYQRHHVEPLQLQAGPSSSSFSTPLPSPYGTASTPLDPDSNFVAYNYSTVAIKRPRGRPRTNFSVKGEGGRKRGRPPTRRA